MQSLPTYARICIFLRRELMHPYALLQLLEEWVPGVGISSPQCQPCLPSWLISRVFLQRAYISPSPNEGLFTKTPAHLKRRQKTTIYISIENNWVKGITSKDDHLPRSLPCLQGSMLYSTLQILFLSMLCFLISFQCVLKLDVTGSLVYSALLN